MPSGNTSPSIGISTAGIHDPHWNEVLARYSWGLITASFGLPNQVVEYDERSGETALPLLRVVGFVVNVDLHHAGTCFEHVAVIGRGGAESDHFHVASDLRQVEAAVLRADRTIWSCPS